MYVYPHLKETHDRTLPPPQKAVESDTKLLQNDAV